MSRPASRRRGLLASRQEEPALPTYRLTIEYEGTRYRGWQEQKNAPRTVAGELRRALEEAAGTAVELGGSGRTDAGVHALGQVAHLRLSRRVDPEPFAHRVNDRLPADIHLLAVEPAGDRFHARHSAVARSYLYQVSRRRTALAKRFVWWVREPLDVAAMAAAAADLAGRHDFRLFAADPEGRRSEKKSTLVVVESATVVATGELVLVRVVASHYLWKMVRRITGALVAVGNGEIDRAAFAALVAGRPARRRGGAPFVPAEHTAPPSGLFLERVLYPGDPPLGELVPAVPVRR
ncbi:MAG TPA: tRNA pseudouridine(38-40) synthase TruA [Thermoanaerobaculia bacterium]|nr:tRNA pseudouridine(38-40) synthase TruA [Thermoanaerobaculia bacterium]